MAPSPSETTYETRNTARVAPQPRANTFLRLVDSDTQPVATDRAPAVASALERAGAEVGFLAWRFVSRSLRWLDGRQEAVSASAPGGRAEVASTRSQAAAHVAAAHVPTAFAAQRPAPVASSRFVAHAQPVDQVGARRSASPDAINVLHKHHVEREALRTSREPLPQAYDLAAETIPALVTFALRTWVKPSWAQMAETGCSVAISASRAFQAARPHNDQPRSLRTVLASATFAVASGVAAISSSGLVGMAATSPWIVALIGGVLLLAIIWRAMDGRVATGPLPWPGGGAMAMS